VAVLLFLLVDGLGDEVVLLDFVDNVRKEGFWVEI